MQNYNNFNEMAAGTGALTNGGTMSVFNAGREDLDAIQKDLGEVIRRLQVFGQVSEARRDTGALKALSDINRQL